MYARSEEHSASSSWKLPKGLECLQLQPRLSLKPTTNCGEERNRHRTLYLPYHVNQNTLRLSKFTYRKHWHRRTSDLHLPCPNVHTTPAISTAPSQNMSNAEMIGLTHRPGNDGLQRVQAHQNARQVLRSKHPDPLRSKPREKNAGRSVGL